jgi:hypothetical protein
MTNETNNTCAALLEACSGFFSDSSGYQSCSCHTHSYGNRIHYREYRFCKPNGLNQNRSLSDVLQNTDQPKQIRIP